MGEDACPGVTKRVGWLTGVRADVRTRRCVVLRFVGRSSTWQGRPEWKAKLEASQCRTAERDTATPLFFGDDEICMLALARTSRISGTRLVIDGPCS